MKFLAIDVNAIDELITNKTLQSDSFSQAEALFDSIRNKKNSQIGRLRVLTTKSGIVIACSSGLNKNRALVFDLSSTNLLKYQNKEVITIIQRSCRFSKKVREGLNFSGSELWVTDHFGRFGMVFPFQYTQNDPCKVFVDFKPDRERQEKRSQEYHLAFAITSEYVDCKSISMTEYNKFTEEIQGINLQSLSENQVTAASSLISNHTYQEISDQISLDTLDYESWDGYLTSTQKSFINSNSLGPTKLLGPAGSGKTLSLILKAVKIITSNTDKRVLYVTHSKSMKLIVENAIKSIMPYFKVGDINNPPYLEVSTLQDICRQKSTEKIDDNELLDADAMDSKITQTMYIEDCISKFVDTELNTFENHLSNSLKIIFNDFRDTKRQYEIADIFLTEFSTIIKGRANAKKENYIKLPRPKYGLPIDPSNENDFNAVYYIFQMYQSTLEKINVFDIDDIVLSAISSLDTFIWNRRRQKEGFDVILIDETHLFNFNELSVFHRLLARPNDNSLIFAYDLIQSPSDLGVGKIYLQEAFGNIGTEETSLGSVFRCSKSIIDLAEFVISSGASLFTEFPSPHDNISSALTFTEERKLVETQLISSLGIDSVVCKSFAEAEKIAVDMKCNRSDILICTSDDEYFKKIASYGEKLNKPFVQLYRRSDYDSIKRARERNLYVLGHIDQVGGTEFSYVILVGVDSERFPLMTSNSVESKHYHEYRALNKLYVALTRARYGIIFISEKSQGPAKVIRSAIELKLIKETA